MISVLVPTVRPKNIPRIEAAVMREDLDAEFIWEEDVEHIGCPKMLKKLVEQAKGEYICFLGDDTDPQQGFLMEALVTMQEKDALLVGFNDLHSKKPTHWLAKRELLDSLENREFFYTGYHHNRCDVELEKRARDLGKYAWCEKAIVKHNHPTFKTAETDEHYERGALNKEKWAKDIALFKQRNCRIAVAMIVKNESSCLEKCLESVKWADQIYIEDTGSEDNTVEIAKKYTDKVSFRAWNDSFADARNSVKEKVKNADWILSIDADEVFISTEEEVRKAVFNYYYADALDIMVTDGKNCTFFFPRLFKNTDRVWWQGAIHNSLHADVHVKVENIGIKYGYSEAHKLDPDRALRILTKEHEKDPANTRIMYYLAREYGYKGRYQEAIDMFDKYVSASTYMAEKADAFYLKATYLWKLRRGDEARRSCLEALNINANFKGAAKLMAQMSWAHNARVWEKMAEAGDNTNVLFIR